MQKRLHDIAEKIEEGTEKHRLYRCPLWREARNQIPEGPGMGAGSRNVEGGCELAKRSHVAPLSESHWRRSHLTVRKWEAGKHHRWGMPVEGFRGHSATDGSLLGVSGRWEGSMRKVSGAA